MKIEAVVTINNEFSTIVEGEQCKVISVWDNYGKVVVRVLNSVGNESEISIDTFKYFFKQIK